MERGRVSMVFLVTLFMSVNQIVRASEDAEFGQEKCFCPPSPPLIGGGSVPSTPSLNPPSGGSYSPPDGPGILSPPPSGAGSSPATPTYASPPPSDGFGSSPAVPSYSSPPPAKGTSPSTPALTPPYTAPSTTPPTKKPPPSYSSPPSPSSSSSSPTTPSYDAPPSPSSTSPNSPSTPSDATPPSTPDDGSRPSAPSPDYSAPTTPSVPDFPPDGSPPGIPGSGTGTCDFWGSHSKSFPDILSMFSSIGYLFGSGSSSSPAWGNDMTLQQALTNNRKDGYGSLLREGSASLLNSLVNPNFTLRPEQVRNGFNGALGSNLAAAVQGAKFKAANEGRLLP